MPDQFARFLTPDTMATTPGYSHVVEVLAGRPVYVSGQVAFDPSGTFVGIGDFRVQAERVFENVRLALEAVGADFSRVVKLNCYVTDISQIAAYREVRDRYITTANPPASTTVQVAALFSPDALIEVEVVAVLPA